MVEGEKDLNSQRHNLLQQVREGKWNQNHFDLLLEVPNDQSLEGLINE